MVVDPTRRNGNIPNVYDGALPPDAFAEIRARADNPLLIINHPRSSGPGFGYFNVADYDRVTGMVGRADHWDEEFSVVEVFNASSFESNRDETVADWFSFLDRGRRVFAVGSSDSHRIYGAPVGYPRTCLDLGTDDVTAITPEMVREATEAGRSYVTGGIYLEVSANAAAAGPGDTVTGAGAMASVHVRVQAADWIDVDQLELIVDGESIAMMPITTGADPLRGRPRRARRRGRQLGDRARARDERHAAPASGPRALRGVEPDLLRALTLRWFATLARPRGVCRERSRSRCRLVPFIVSSSPTVVRSRRASRGRVISSGSRRSSACPRPTRRRRTPRIARRCCSGPDARRRATSIRCASCRPRSKRAAPRSIRAGAS
jgi:hypothetical protein